MPRIVWISPDNTKTYITTNINDPNIPVGYIKTNTSDGSGQVVDGVQDSNLQKFVGGLASGGYPQYSGYTDGSGSGKWPNGHLGGD
jgi:hypothetical protein